MWQVEGAKRKGLEQDEPHGAVECLEGEGEVDRQRGGLWKNFLFDQLRFYQAYIFYWIMSVYLM